MLTVTSVVGLVQVGGLPLAATPKAKTLRVVARSQLAFTPFAMQALGTPPLALLRPVSGWGFVWPVQSKLSLQIFNCVPPTPSATRPPKEGSKVSVLSVGGQNIGSDDLVWMEVLQRNHSPPPPRRFHPTCPERGCIHRYRRPSRREK